ncbi:MAG: polysaccharide pyruvyl transferase family protein [Bacteroidales bacterium]|nr:polysaccharide pyruvyl transferase family protein [Bacteroidales bacterium]
MAKIGIITIYDVVNAGALLQCYSLCEYLKCVGHTPLLFHIPLNQRTFARRIKRCICAPKVNQFIKNKLPYRTDDLTHPVDIYLVGSDQVWNPQITLDRWKEYFVSFAPENSKIAAYSASFGVNNWTFKSLTTEVRDLLNRFAYISVREQTGVNILQEVFDLPATHVLDPCFLIDDFERRFALKKKLCDPQVKKIVTYKLVQNAEWKNFLRQLSKSPNSDINQINGKIIPSLPDLRGFNSKKLNPQSWLQSIYEADLVITDSFHGTVFSILFNRQFIVLPGVSGRSSRILDLLRTLGLQSRYVSSTSDIEILFNVKINYTDVKERLKSLQEDSKNILRKIVG